MENYLNHFRYEAPTFDDYAEAVCEIMNTEFAGIEEKASINTGARNFYGSKCLFFYCKSD